jgi:hypothetical protein
MVLCVGGEVRLAGLGHHHQLLPGDRLPHRPLQRLEQQQHTLKLIGSKQCCGSGMFIPDPNFLHPGSASKNLSILTQKNGFLALRNMIWVVYPGFGS